MRAIVCRRLGNPRQALLEELPAPSLAPNQVRVAVYAAGVNFSDGLMLAGTYQEKPPLPFVPGFEVSGIVTEIGSGVHSRAVGERVMGITICGGYADEIVINADSVFRIPDTMSFEQAAGFPVAHGTSHGAFEWRAKLLPGETLMVNGAAGGVGLTGVEIGKAMGATVIATASSPEKLAIAAGRGADYLIDTSAEDVKERVMAITNGRGVDVIYDPVGGEAFDFSLRCASWEGRIIVIGFASGKVPQIPANIMLVKNSTVMGFNWGAYRDRYKGRVRASFETLITWVSEGKLKPQQPQTFPLADAAQAIELLQSRKSTGKIVLVTR